MTSTRATAIAALLATVGFASLPVMAQSPMPGAQPEAPMAGTPTPALPDDAGPMLRHRAGNPALMDVRMLRGNRGAQILAMSCAPRAADRMETGFERMAERLSLTDAQQSLFDTLMTSALSAQTDYADRCAELTPDRGAEGRPDLLQRLETRLKLDEARLAAFTAVLPDFRAFYESLTEEQQADLLTRRGERDDRGRDHSRHRDHRDHRSEHRQG